MVFNSNITEITSSTTLDTGFDVYIVDASGGNITITLPAIVADGMQYKLKRTDATGNIVTITGIGGETIDGNLIITLDADIPIEIQSFDSAWYIVMTSPTGGGASLWEEAAVTTGTSVRLNLAEAAITDDLIFPEQSTEASGAMVLFDTSKGAFRAGQGGLTAWLNTNRGNHSVAFGNLNRASGNSSTIGGGVSNIASGLLSTIGGGKNNSALADYSTISGGTGNLIDLNAGTSTIGGGSLNQILITGAYSTIGGGCSNTIDGPYMTISGGCNNKITDSENCTIGGGSNNIIASFADGSTIGGGGGNFISGTSNFIGGGFLNKIITGSSVIGGGENNTITGFYAVIGGGENNKVISDYTTVIGGNGNTAVGTSSIACGRNAKANSNDTFVWADRNGFSTTVNTDCFIAAGGGNASGTTLAAIFYSNKARTTGVKLVAKANAWSSISDRNKKENIVELNYNQILEKLDRIPMYQYNFIGTDKSMVCMGPMAQDWRAEFPSKEHGLLLNTAELDGVALTSIKALSEQVKKLTEREKIQDLLIADLQKTVKILMDK